jgi:glycerol-3-phosphate dehydrogenase
VLAARHEQARSIGDVLLRRTRLGLLAARQLTDEPAAPPSGSQRGGGPVQRVGAVLARELDWSAQRLSAELASFAEEARAEGIATGAAPSEDALQGAANAARVADPAP